MSIATQVQLRKMTQSEYERRSRFAYDSFIEDATAHSGESIESVRARVGGPAPEPSADDLWYVVEREGADVGYFWIQLLPQVSSHEREAFGYDIYLEEASRGVGIGRLAMLEGKRLLSQYGVKRLKICVFADNLPARKLYASLGFKEVSFKENKRQYEMEIEI